jgi:hypothetical protein
MMSQRIGFTRPLPAPRRLLGDVLQVAQRVPVAIVERKMLLTSTAQTRARAVPRPGWCAVFTKAWAVVCKRHPELRRCLLGGLVPRLYEHPGNVATIAVEREYQGEPTLFFVQIDSPEEAGLLELEEQLEHYKTCPLQEEAVFRQQMRRTAMPGSLRRLILWAELHLSGRQRARKFGTFGVVGLPGLDVRVLRQTALLTSTLDYDTVAPDGSVEVRILCDQRVIDPAVAGRALGDLERVLRYEITTELRYLHALEERAA